MITRKVRENLKRVADSEFMNLTEDLLNGEVIDMAVHLYGILSVISNKYTNDAIVDLIPELSSLLNRLDAAIKINSDLTEQIIEINQENNILKKKIEEEKTRQNVNIEESLCMEEMFETELYKLKEENRIMKEEEQALKKEIANSNELVSALICDCEKLTKEVHRYKKSVFLNESPTKHTFDLIGQSKAVKQREKTKNNYIETANQYSVLANVEDLSKTPNTKCRIQTKAQVHRSASFSPKTAKQLKSVDKHRKCKNKIIVLSDSQGKNIHPHIQNLTKDYQVFVYTMPGARLKDVVNHSKAFIEECSNNDFIVLLAGTNDIGRCEPSQLSITQGVKSLLSLRVDTNVIINSVPYRFDKTQFNDNIFYANMAITRLVRDYRGPLRLSYGDLNAVLNRNHFTRHGLHINKAGKRVLGRNIVHTVNRRVQAMLPGTVDDIWRDSCNKTEGAALPERRTAKTAKSHPRRQQGKTRTDQNAILTTNSQLKHLDDIYPDPNYVPYLTVSLTPTTTPGSTKSLSPSLPPSLSSVTEYPPLLSSISGIDCLGSLNDSNDGDNISYGWEHINSSPSIVSNKCNTTVDNNHGNVNRQLFLGELNK